MHGLAANDRSTAIPARVVAQSGSAGLRGPSPLLTGPHLAILPASSAAAARSPAAPVRLKGPVQVGFKAAGRSISEAVGRVGRSPAFSQAASLGWGSSLIAWPARDWRGPAQRPQGEKEGENRALPEGAGLLAHGGDRDCWRPLMRNTNTGSWDWNWAASWSRRWPLVKFALRSQCQDSEDLTEGVVASGKPKLCSVWQ